MKKAVFYAEKLIKDFFFPLKYKIFLEKDRVTYYPFLFDEEILKKGGSQDFSFDSEGIPIIPEYIDIRKGKEKKYHYFPISIGQYGLAIYHSYLKSKDSKDRDRFLKIADWYYDNQETDGTWRATVPVPKFNLEKGWASAMAQSRGISILIRGWIETKDDKYLKAADRALEPLEKPIDRGGLLDKVDGNIFYEEYPSKPEGNHVLNGMIFTLFGLWEYSKLGNTKAEKLLKMGIDSVEKTLGEYDLGYWTKYDLGDTVYGKSINTATGHYHNIHIKQLEIINYIRKSQMIGDILERWKRYEKNKINLIRAYLLKISFLYGRGR